MPVQLRQARMKMQELTGRSADTLWVGETGWSSPRAASLTTPMQDCPAWSSEQTYRDFYQGFLKWDFNIGGGMRSPDHAFWFTMRDSINFGAGEHFGLVATCDDPACKVKSAGFEAGSYSLFFGPGKTTCGDAALYNDWVVGGQQHCRNRCTMLEQCRFYTIWPLSHDDHYWCRLTSSCDLKEATDPHVVSVYARLGMPPVPTPAPQLAPAPRPTSAPAPEVTSPGPTPEVRPQSPGSAPEDGPQPRPSPGASKTPGTASAPSPEVTSPRPTPEGRPQLRPSPGASKAPGTVAPGTAPLSPGTDLGVTAHCHRQELAGLAWVPAAVAAFLTAV